MCARFINVIGYALHTHTVFSPVYVRHVMTVGHAYNTGLHFRINWLYIWWYYVFNRDHWHSFQYYLTKFSCRLILSFGNRYTCKFSGGSKRVSQDRARKHATQKYVTMPLFETTPTLWVEPMDFSSYMACVCTVFSFVSALPATFPWDGQLQLVKKLGTRQWSFFRVQSCCIMLVQVHLSMASKGVSMETYEPLWIRHWN